jgi:hypothetical protein
LRRLAGLGLGIVLVGMAVLVLTCFMQVGLYEECRRDWPPYGFALLVVGIGLIVWGAAPARRTDADHR